MDSRRAALGPAPSKGIPMNRLEFRDWFLTAAILLGAMVLITALSL